MGGSSSLYVTTLPSLVAMGIAVVEINAFNLSRDLTWSRVHTAVGLNDFRFLIVSYHFAKFSGYNLWYVVHDLTRSRDQMICWLYGSELLIVHCHRHCVNGYTIISICQVILQVYVIIQSYKFMGRNHSK